MFCLAMIVYYVTINDDNNAIIFVAMFYTSSHIIVHVYDLMKDYETIKLELEQYKDSSNNSVHNPIPSGNGLQLMSNAFHALPEDVC